MQETLRANHHAKAKKRCWQAREKSRCILYVITWLARRLHLNADWLGRQHLNCNWQKGIAALRQILRNLRASGLVKCKTTQAHDYFTLMQRLIEKRHIKLIYTDQKMAREEILFPRKLQKLWLYIDYSLRRYSAILTLKPGHVNVDLQGRA